MKWFVALVLFAVALVATPGAAGEAQARERGPGGSDSRIFVTEDFVTEDNASGDVVPLNQVLANLRSRYSGDMLEVDGGSRDGGSKPYRIKWLTDDGAVLYITVEAATGQVLSVQGEN